MKTKLNITKREGLIIGITLIAGLFFGWLLFHGKSNATGNNLNSAMFEHQEDHIIWTCSMHPQIRMDEPGQCPICGMDLIPLNEIGGNKEAISPDEIQMTEEAMKLADIQTMVVQKGYPDKEIFLLGKVKPDERNIAELTARFGGRIEKLYVNFTGQDISKGEKLATIYSPALVTAQRELIEAREYKESNPEFYNAARNKLKLWDLTDEQINNIEQKGEAQHYFDVLSPISGTVTMRHVALGDYIKEGTPLFQVINLSYVWLMFEAYESDLPWIKKGDKANFMVQSLPGKKFSGRVSFIDPIIDLKTRIARVRVEVKNTGLLLKPEMFANGIITSSIAGNKKDILIPKTAILWTGKRAVVYIKVPDREQPVFTYREIVLGPVAGDFYIVNQGLQVGEEIAVNGVFKIDAAAQLAGKPSMMNPPSAKDTESKPIDGKSSIAYNHSNMSIPDNMTTDLKHQSHTINDKAETTIKSKFKKQLSDVFTAYIEMKDAFINSDSKLVEVAAEKLRNNLDAVDMKLLSGENHILWMDYLKILTNSVEKIKSTADIEIQRRSFAEFNLAFYKSLKKFGLPEGTVYYQYCPMAVGNKGAYWFSKQAEIKNPYFGEKMLKCGEIREEMNY